MILLTCVTGKHIRMKIRVSTYVCVIFLEQVQLEKTDPLGATWQGLGESQAFKC